MNEQTRILLVDDEWRAITLAAALLRQLGYHTVCKCDYASALITLRDEQFDVMIVDLNLPGESTVECLAQIKGVFHGPIVLMSAYTEDDVDPAVLEFVNGFVPKPYVVEWIHEKVQSVLGRT